MKKSVCGPVLGIVMGVLLAGCSDDPGTVFIGLDHDVSGEALVFNSIEYTNAAGQDYSVSTLKYYVSDVVLHKTDGGQHARTLVHYRDAADPDTRLVELGGVEGGSYDLVSFVFGLNDAHNVTGGLPATTENLAMQWPAPMGGGYHYMKLEGEFINGAGDTLGVTTHTGRNGTVPHFFQVTVPMPTIDVDGNSHTIRVIMDIDEWYTNPHTYSFPAPSMIMGNSAVQDTLAMNGANAFRVGS